MTNNEYNQLFKIFNNLCTVMTSGDNTVIMAQCLTEFNNFLLNAKKNITKEGE